LRAGRARCRARVDADFELILERGDDAELRGHVEELLQTLRQGW